MNQTVQPMPLEPLLTIDQVAGLLGCNEKTVRTIVSDGKLPRVVIGKRRVMFDPADVRAYIEGAKECQSIRRAASGTTTSSTKGGVTTVRRAKNQKGLLKPWSAKGDLKPRPEAIQTQAK